MSEELQFPESHEETRSIEERFIEFHDEYPQVYAALRDLALQGVQSGRTKLGIGMLWEVLRWNTMLGDPDAEYKLNDHYRSRYARLLMEQETELAGIFEIRSLRSE